jgi:hypothetical protein
MQRVGAPLIVMGIIIAARPFIRVGPRVWIEITLPRVGVFPTGPGKIQRVVKRVRPEIEKDVSATQIWGPLLLVLGTILSGYGDLLADGWLKLFGRICTPS